MRRRSVSIPLFAVLLFANVLLAGAVATPAIGASDQGAVAAKKKNEKRYAPIRGRLSKRGYTLIALADSGRGKAVEVKARRFTLRPPAKVVTLHLRAPDGTYAGPIVLGGREHGKRAIVGVKAGAKLGKVKIKPSKGYAKPSGKVAKKWLDATRLARAKKGLPIGADGRIGLVRSKPPKHPPAGDLDFDGVPNSLDVDDDGDLILDQYDRSSSSHSKRVASQSQSSIGAPFLDGNFLDITTDLGGGGTFPGQAVNVNAGSSDAQIAAAQQELGRLGLLWIGIDPGSGEIDCGGRPDPDNPEGWIGGLSYCTRGGTGRFQVTGQTQRAGAPSFPGPPGGPYDLDGDGLGSLIATQFDNSSSSSGWGNTTLFPGATQYQLRAGDVLVERATMHGQRVDIPSTIGFVFSTQAVIAAYDDGQGDSADFSYPNAGAPAPVHASPNGDVVLKLKFWRPQRLRISGEPGDNEWMDVGNLTYAAEVALEQPGATPGTCPQSSYSEVDPSLTPDPSAEAHSGPPTLGAPRFLDTSGDQSSSRANTFAFTLNVTDCLASKGQSMDTAVPAAVVIGAFSEIPAGPAFMTSSKATFKLQP